MKLFKGKTISLLVLSLIYSLIIISIVFVLYLAIFQSRLKDNFTGLIENNNVETTNSISSEISERFVSINVQVLSIHSTLDTFGNTNKEMMDDFFTNQFPNTNLDMTYVITDVNGIIVYCFPENLEAIGNDESRKEYFTSTTDVNEIFWSKPYRSNITGEEKITISIHSNDYYLLVHLDLNYLESIYHQIIDNASGKELIIVDEYGIIIYDSLTTNDDIHLPLVDFSTYKNEKNNELFDFEYENNQFIASKSTVESTSWTLILFQDRNIITSFVGFIERQLISVNLIILFLASIMIAVGGQILSRKISSFVSSLNRLSQGEEKVVFESSKITLLNRMSNELNQASLNIDQFNKTLKETAYIDSLTKLFNRASIKREFLKLNHQLKHHFIMINIKRFSLYNESYGYDFGNELLITFSEKIKEILTNNCIFGRLENDKFLIITQSEPETVTSKITELFSKNLIINHVVIEISINYYLIESPKYGTSFDALIANLMQISHLKLDSDNSITPFKEDFIKLFERQIEIELSLERSLINRDFNVVFQPIVLKDNPSIIRGFEALARWTHNKLNIVSPSEFIPILEKTHKVYRLDYIIIFESIKMIKELSKKMKTNYVLSCNVSVDTLLHKGFRDFIIDTLKKFNYDPRYLEIEITESTIIVDPPLVISIINDLSSYGVRFSQDDFGDGYSSLSYLTQLNISTLKLSKSLIDGLTNQFNNRLLVTTVIDLAHELGFEVIVEGVETIEVINILKDFNCDYVQGYYYHKPIDYLALLDLLNK